MTSVSRHYVLAAGGTGGHLIPAFALAQELDRRGHHVALITDARGEAIPGKPAFLTAHVLPAGRVQGKNPIQWIKGLAAIAEGRKGPAKGGVLAAIAQERPIPVYFIGVGEQLADLETFNAREFAEALLA